MRRLFRLTLLIATPALLPSLAVPARADVVTGQVLGPDGAAVAGAQVIVTGAHGVRNPNNYCETASDAAGEFKGEIADSRGGQVWVYKPGLVLGFADLQDGCATLRLTAGVTVRGVVRDAEDRPVAGVTVSPLTDLYFYQSKSSLGSRLGRPGLAAVPEPFRAIYVVKSNADGGWAINDMPNFRRGHLMFNATRAPGERWYTERTDETPTEYLLRPVATIKGRVRLEDGGVPPQVGVGATRLDGIATHFTQSDRQDGSFAFLNVAGDNYRLYVRPWSDKREQPSDWVLSHHENVKTTAGRETVAPDLILTHGIAVEGRVTDAVTGAPLAGITVRSSPTDAVSIVEAEGITDHTGHYRLWLAPGEHRLDTTTNLPEYYSTAAGATLLTVERGDAKRLDFTLKQGAEVQGLLIDENGLPLENATVSLRPLFKTSSILVYGNEPTPTVATQTDAKGEWRLGGLRPGQYELTVTGLWQVRMFPIGLVAGIQPLKLAVARHGKARLIGRVVTQTGIALSGAKVSVTVGSPETNSRLDMVQRDYITDATGHFVVEGLRAEYKFLVEASKPGFRFVSGGTVKSAAGQLSIDDIVMSAQ